MGRDLRIAFIGAGGVNFGSPTKPWDHATRLEKLGGVTVVGVADPDMEKAQKALAERLAGPARKMYAGAKAYADERALLGEARPEAVLIGLPPTAHGQSRPPHDMEMLCAAAGIHMFIEKPLSVLGPSETADVAASLPSTLVHKNRRIDAIHIIAVINKTLPPNLLYIVLQSHSKWSIIPSTS